MEARVKATGKIVEISTFQDIDKIPTTYDENELEFLIPTDYWTRLEHQYAGMAMQGLMSKEYLDNPDSLVSHAIHYAHALVEKLKEKEERK